jgi:hypothetical protein
MAHTGMVSPNSEPKRFKLASRSFGIDASEAADVLITAKEIMANKALNKAAMKVLKDKKKAIDSTLKS